MYRKLVGVLYVMNIVFQSFLTLLTPVGLCFFISWLLEEYAGVGRWIYAPLLIIGVLSGFYSMVKFVLTAMSGYERLEAEQNKNNKNTKGNNNEEK